MFSHKTRMGIPSLALGVVLALGAAPVSADVFPVSTSGRSRVYAEVFPNPSPPYDTHTYFGSTGDFAANSYEYDSIGVIPTAGASCEVFGSSTCHIDDLGATGAATLNAHWIATNTMSVPGDQLGVFDSSNYFKYTFITDTPGTITIDVNSASNLPNIIPPTSDDPVNYSMAINNTVTFDGEYTDLHLNDSVHLVYPIDPGYYELLLERDPNGGIGPWPNCDVYTTSTLSFTIETEPTPHVLGDMDCDDDVDLDDVPAMVDALLDPGLYQEFYGCLEHGDLTGDELIDGADLQAFVDLLIGG